MDIRNGFPFESLNNKDCMRTSVICYFTSKSDDRTPFIEIFAMNLCRDFEHYVDVVVCHCASNILHSSVIIQVVASNAINARLRLIIVFTIWLRNMENIKEKRKISLLLCLHIGIARIPNSISNFLRRCFGCFF